MTGELNGRVAVITGASRGIGAATARLFAEAGAAVVLAARPSDDLAAVAAETRGFALPTDVRAEAQIEALMAATFERFGALDVLVNAAGTGRFGAVVELSTDDWDATIDVNLRGTFLACRAALPYLQRSGAGGHIFTLVSIAAIRTFTGAAAYCASKSGLLGLTRVLAEEVRREGIKVTAVIPGAVDSPFWEASGGTDLPRDAMLRPEDVARTIVWIASQPPHVYTDEITIMPPGGVL